MAELRADFGTVDILVNNACICRMIQILDIGLVMD